jgi:type II secretory pathway pseudopilin PulG
MKTGVHDRSLTLPRLVAALGAIVILALVLPYMAVHTFHQRRLDRADRQLESIAASVSARVGTKPSAVPAATHVLAGSGQPPIVTDDEWNTASAFPLARAIADPGADPWGNAYLVNVADRKRMWVISAGPDGILQTPFLAANGPVADDRAAPVR